MHIKRLFHPMDYSTVTINDDGQKEFDFFKLLYFQKCSRVLSIELTLN